MQQRLLICFDAFGTLFTPKRPVHQQYADVARSVGLGGFRDADVEQSFKNAYKQEATRHPNFGKADGMNAEQWWTNIITNTFRPLVGNDKPLPRELTPTLLHRFWSDEGYRLMADVQTLFRRLESRFTHGEDRRVIVGVVTNSDDRVPDILTSLGLRVGPLRHGSKIADAGVSGDYDIDFTILSFDVGHEKPAVQIFQAAEGMLEAVVPSLGEDSKRTPASWDKIYVGDEYKKDIVGAVNAGWKAVLIGPKEEVDQHTDVRWMEDSPQTDLADVFRESPAIGLSRLGKLATALAVRTRSPPT